MKASIRKIFLALTAIFFVASMFCATFIANAQEGQQVKKTVNEVVFTMDKGAGVRLNDDGKNGLRFTANMSLSDYSGLIANVGDGEEYAYSSLKFGMIIAPAYYNEQEGFELTKENIFGEKAKYDWAIDGIYNGSNSVQTKLRIINLQTTVMNEIESKNIAQYYGSITNIKDGTGDDGFNNLALEFMGVGYVEYTDQAGNTDWIFFENNDNVRSMAFVAQETIDNPNTTEEDVYTLQTNYLDKVTSVASNYSINYYVQKLDKSGYELKETVTTTSTIGAVESITDKYYLDYHRVSDLPEEVVVYANDKTSIDVKYDLGAMWNTVDNITDVKTQTASHIDSAGTGNTNSQYDVSISNVNGESVLTWTLKSGKSNKAYKHGFNVLPAYNKAYYETYLNLGYELCFEYMYEYVEEHSGSRYGVYNNDTTYTNADIMYSDVWYTAKISLDTLLGNWDALQINKVTSPQYNVIYASLIRTWKDGNDTVDFKMNMKNIRLVPGAISTPVVDQTVNLVDVANSGLVSDNKLNLLSLISAENKSILASNLNYAECLTYNLTNNSGVQTTVKGILDLTDIDLRYYEFNVLYNGTVIYTGAVDLFNSNEGVIWNTFDMINVNTDWRSHQGNIYTGDTNKHHTFSIGAVDGKEGTYAIWTNKDSAGYAQHFTILPVHSLEYYTQYVGQGYKISYEYKYVTLSTPSTESWRKYVCGFNAAYSEPKPGQWYTLRYSIDSIADAYGYMFGEHTNSASRKGALLSFSGGTVVNTETDKGLAFDVYIGAITISK